jgi:endonuclease/exonuclease/phosphatase family metal-dependent hydrolase
VPDQNVIAEVESPPEAPPTRTTRVAGLLRRLKVGQPSGASVRPGRRRWGWGTRLAVTMCLAWLVLVVAHKVISGRAYWWGQVDLLPPFVFAAMPVLLAVVALFTRRVRWRLTFVAVLALLLGAGSSGINLATVWYSPPPAGPGAITVVTWNTMYWDQDMISDGRRTTDDFYRFLRDMNADVYMLHEYAHVDFTPADIFSQVQPIDQMDRLRQEFPGYQIVIAGRNVTLSRFPVVASRGLDSTPWLPEEFRPVPAALREHAAFYNSQTLRADIQLPEKVVSFYNAHLYQPPSRLLSLSGDRSRGRIETDRFNDGMRKASLHALRSDMADNSQPIVFGGDLNTTPAMGIRRLLPHQLVDHTRALSSMYPTTWSVGGSNSERKLGASLWRIDWILSTPDIAVHRYDLVDPAGLSDHRPQRVVLSTGEQP